MINKGIIVSCQAEENSYFNNPESILAFSLEAIKGGAIGLRIRDCENVKSVRHKTNVPIIGLTKSTFNDSGCVLITGSVSDALELERAGADYIATDATGRNDLNVIKEMKDQLNIDIIGDLSNINQAEKAIDYGCSILTTALSGYTEKLHCSVYDEPDYKLLKELVINFNVPILAEGRYWELDQVKKAFDLGATSVVIGSAITRPHLITKRFSRLINKGM
jgi:N-acylglucosamine-6-phosphate 2-epimerase